MKVVSERLGHKSAAFTLKQYVHVLLGMQREAASRIASVVFDEIDSTSPLSSNPMA